MDLSELTREPVELTLGGRTWHVKPRTLAELGALQSWFKRTIPSPLVRAAEAIAQARRLGVELPKAVEDLMLDHASRAAAAWPPLIGSWQWRRAVDDADAAAEVVRFALAPCHPQITLDQAGEILAAAEPGELGTLACVLFEGRLPDPKELMPATEPTASPTMRSPTPSVTTGAPGSTISAPAGAGPTA